jgi:hypothetical protein
MRSYAKMYRIDTPRVGLRVSICGNFLLFNVDSVCESTTNLPFLVKTLLKSIEIKNNEEDIQIITPLLLGSELVNDTRS